MSSSEDVVAETVNRPYPTALAPSCEHKMHNDAPTAPRGEEDCAERLARKRTIRLMH